MRTTLTRRTARAAAVLGVVPVALALFAGGNASAQKPAVYTTVTSPTGAAAIGSSVDNTIDTDRKYLPQTGPQFTNTSMQGGKVAGANNTPADFQQPAGQLKTRDALNGHSRGNNNGYECDGNRGIGDGNPAHTSSCVTTSDSQPE